jgi:hypothetical protein
MRDQAYLTGKEYRQIVLFLRRWHDVGPPTPSVTRSPKRFVFSQSIAELRGETIPPPPPSGPGPWPKPEGNVRTAQPPQRPPDGLPLPLD